MMLRVRCLCITLFCTALLTGCVETLPLKADDSLSFNPPFVEQNDAGTRDALKSISAMQERLDNVAAPLLIKNASACKKLARPLLGFTAKNKYAYSPSLSRAAQEALGLGEMLQVIDIMAGSGAARSGLQRGDVLISAGGKPMPQGPNAQYEAPAVLLPLMLGQPSIKLSVLRAGNNVAISLPLTEACALRVEVGNTDNVNSYADGRRILLTRGMIKFVRSDEELAFVIAREMAHNALRHPARLGTSAKSADVINAMMQVHPDGRSLEIASTLKPMPAEMDALADRLAVYMLTRGGVRIDSVSAFWKRLAKAIPASDLLGHTALHPATAARIDAIDKTVTSIQARQSRKREFQHSAKLKHKRSAKRGNKRKTKRKRKH